MAQAGGGDILSGLTPQRQPALGVSMCFTGVWACRSLEALCTRSWAAMVD